MTVSTSVLTALILLVNLASNFAALASRFYSRAAYLALSFERLAALFCFSKA
jgi:hypothetical protein